MPKEDDEHFARIELPNALRAIYVRATTNPALARKLVFDHFAYVGADADKKSPHAHILKALAFCFKTINVNAHDDPAAARKIVKQLERIQ